MEKEHYDNLNEHEKEEYKREKRKQENIKRLGLYGAGLATVGLGIGIPILMAKGTWDILNDDSMTTPISTNNDTISNDETSVVNEPAYATYDYTEDDYGNITYYVQNPDGTVETETIRDLDDDNIIDSYSYTQINPDGSYAEYDEYDYDDDGVSDRAYVHVYDENGNLTREGVAVDTNEDGNVDGTLKIGYDENGNISSTHTQLDIDHDGEWDLDF